MENICAIKQLAEMQDHQDFNNAVKVREIHQKHQRKRNTALSDLANIDFALTENKLRGLLVALLSSLCLFLTVFQSEVALAHYLQESIDDDPLKSTLAWSSFYVSAAIAAPVCGLLVDLFFIRWPVVVLVLFLCASSLVFALSDFPRQGELLYLGRVLSGIASAGLCVAIIKAGSIYLKSNFIDALVSTAIIAIFSSYGAARCIELWVDTPNYFLLYILSGCLSLLMGIILGISGIEPAVTQSVQQLRLRRPIATVTKEVSKQGCNPFHRLTTNGKKRAPKPPKIRLSFSWSDRLDVLKVAFKSLFRTRDSAIFAALGLHTLCISGMLIVLLQTYTTTYLRSIEIGASQLFYDTATLAFVPGGIMGALLCSIVMQNTGCLFLNFASSFGLALMIYFLEFLAKQPFYVFLLVYGWMAVFFSLSFSASLSTGKELFPLQASGIAVGAIMFYITCGAVILSFLNDPVSSLNGAEGVQKRLNSLWLMTALVCASIILCIFVRETRTLVFIKSKLAALFERQTRSRTRGRTIATQR